jgi:hypothetical protein
MAPSPSTPAAGAATNSPNTAANKFVLVVPMAATGAAAPSSKDKPTAAVWAASPHCRVASMLPCNDMVKKTLLVKMVQMETMTSLREMMKDARIFGL